MVVVRCLSIVGCCCFFCLLSNVWLLLMVVCKYGLLVVRCGTS